MAKLIVIATSLSFEICTFYSFSRTHYSHTDMVPFTVVFIYVDVFINGTGYFHQLEMSVHDLLECIPNIPLPVKIMSAMITMDTLTLLIIMLKC